jgi:hypothetical protein
MMPKLVCLLAAALMGYLQRNTDPNVATKQRHWFPHDHLKASHDDAHGTGRQSLSWQHSFGYQE